MKRSHWSELNLARAQRILCAASLVVAAGCAADTVDDTEATESVTEVEQPVVYGIDDRKEVGQHSDAALRRLAQASTVSVMLSSALNTSNPSNVTVNGATLQTLFNLCTNQNQKFLTDQAPGKCSGTLIDDDLVLTAGHCISAADCADHRFVFNRLREPDGTLRTVTTDDVFSCASVLHDVENATRDFAIVRLDRPATPRFTPAPVRVNRAPLSHGVRLGVVGLPYGIPIKIDSGGHVLDPSTGTAFFTGSLDTFRGNSGGGIYEVGTYQLSGVLSGGQTDWVPGPAGSVPAGCQVASVCPESGCASGPGSPPHAESVAYIGPALDVFCAANPTNARLCGAQRNTFAFSASNTASATQNTIEHYVFLEPGATIDFGTCGTPGGSGTGDTYLRLVSPSGATVASSDDGGGSCGGLSHATFTAPAFFAGMYEIQAGCFSTGACSGTVAYTVSGPSGGSFSYSASSTNNATVNTRDVVINVEQGSVITAGTCSPSSVTPVPPAPLERARFSGNTYLRLLSGATLVASNNDACGGTGSQLTYTATATGPLTLRAGCSSNTACSGTVSYTVGRVNSAYSATNTSTATINTANQDVQLGVGDQITVGTCGMMGASFTGDTFIRLFSGATEVASNDDACNGRGSLLTYRATTAGTHQLRSGCFGSGSCTGTPVVQVMRAAAMRTGAGTFSYIASTTANATQNTVNERLFLRAGQTVQLGTCPSVPGGTGLGDTYVRLFGPSSAEVSSNDNNCGTLGGALYSSLTYTVPVGHEGSYELRGGCAVDTPCVATIGLVDQ
ncbi:trypsin-like serine peptidase [Sorangium sp. So ce406]|uniref:trypsin-like serine peptidase n=1 Tax=Sorangium sp. So ce406 TaxID=3133311 RepID=UPI003F5AEBA8